MSFAKRLKRRAGDRLLHRLATSRGLEVHAAGPAREPEPEPPAPLLAPTLDALATRVMLDQREDLFVVQIGAFDGISGDPIHHLIQRHGWRGLLVEPQPPAFARLQRTYGDNDRIDVRQVAVGDPPGPRTMYVVNAAGTSWPATVEQMASFDRGSIATHEVYFAGISERIEETTVDVVTFSDLLESVDQVDVLQIDAEGYDADLIQMFDFRRWQPSIVQFEHRHVELDAHKAAVERLRRFGYSVWVDEFDTRAHRPAQ